MASLSDSNNGTSLVTIIIPTYNYGRFLGQTLESVLAQTYQNWECIVVDDGSTDNTREVVEPYVRRDPRIRYIYQSNQRAGTARNNGIRNGRGAYLQFLDADDLIEAQKIERQVEYLERHPEVDIIYGSVRSFHTDQPITNLSETFGEESLWMPRLSGSGKEILMELIRLPLLIHAPLVRKGSGGSIIWFDEKLKACEDWLFWVNCALRGRRFHYEKIKGTLSFYRTHETSACADRPLVDSETRRLRKELSAIINDREARRLNQRLAAEYEGELAVKAMAEGKIGRAVRRLVKAGAISPGYSEKMKWFFCAGIAPFAPRSGFESVIATPVVESVTNILKRNTRRAI
jgi:glycosyltransferase involved in cell wall biosynthesis